MSAAPPEASAYERLAYPGYAYPATHPGRLEAIARLFGLKSPDAARSRILELGCGDGGNLLSLAQALPAASMVGIDGSASAVGRGRELARAAGLANVELRCASIETLPDSAEPAGSFDYILCHGVYSWVPPRVRVALLTAVRRLLAPTGIAYVSYNAYPGSYLRDMASDILAYHVREIPDPEDKLAAAQELMRTIVAIEERSPYARVLRDQMERMLRYSDALLFHDDLAEVATPFYFHEFIEHAAQHRLQFLSEAELFESRMRDVPDSAAQLMATLPADALIREQYLDFFKNRMFRQTLLCHDALELGRELDDRRIEPLAISSPVRPQAQQSVGDETFMTPEGFSVTTSEPPIRAALQALADAWPGSLGFPGLASRALEAAGPGVSSAAVAARLREVLLQAHLARIVLLQSSPSPAAARVSERPRASPLARAQCVAGAPLVSSLLHGNVRLEGELERALFGLLDGDRDRAELARALGAPPERVAEALQRMASLGLLAA